MEKLLKGFAPRTGLCILSPVLKDTMQIEGGGYWPLLTLRGACATAAAEIRLKASGMNPDTLRVNKTMFFYKAIEAVSDEDTLATDAMARIAGGIGCFGELYASVGIHGFKLASARNTPLNQATPLDMASLLGRLMRYKDHLFREHPDIYETQDYLEQSLENKGWPTTDYTLACAEVGGRRVLNVIASVGGHLLVVFMEGTDVSEETLMKKAGELIQVAKDNLP
ncbi:hypothetical protein [Bacteroides sp. ET71]|uniref:hypothetical protein n=1 Tax=Bacteroides sp. ET71 TaxID=2939421 RepID=UPI002013324B|nr:hypothetical protein [Bacteroides sp. ET71]